MKIFFDTEFYENGKTIDLISIGMVREDGKTYYAEVISADTICRNDPWLVENVASNLTLPYSERKHPYTIAKEIVEFVGDSPEFWAYYADYDWVVFCWLFGKMIDLPDGFPMYCFDIKQRMDKMFHDLWWVISFKNGDNRLIFGSPNTDRYINQIVNSEEEMIQVLKANIDYPKNTGIHNALHDARNARDLNHYLDIL